MKDVHGKEIVLDAQVMILPEYLLNDKEENHMSEETWQNHLNRIYTVDSVTYDSPDGNILVSDAHGGQGCFDYMLEVVKLPVYQDTLEKVKNGSKFYINFKDRVCKVDNEYVIKDGKFEGFLGVGKLTTEGVLKQMESLYADYKVSIPSERTQGKRKRYFNALPLDELSSDDMLFANRREYAQCALELFFLCCLVNGSFKWEEIEDERTNYFWQSKKDKDLIILKSWIF